MKLSRLEALADALFAIVMTLLVLELKVPTLADHASSGDLLLGLIDLSPKFLTFIISFIILAIYWTSQHIQFSLIKEINFNYLWINLRFLLAICLIPFSTALFGEYPLDQVAQIFYGINLIVCALILYHSWSYARQKKLVQAERITDELQRNARYKMLLPTAVYVLAICLSFVNTVASLFFFIVGPLIYFIPVDSKTWQKLTKPLAG